MKTNVLWLYKMVARVIPESRGFGFKAWMLRRAGAKVGANVRIYSSAVFLGNGELQIGDDVHVGSSVFISAVAPAGVKIGNCIDIGPQVMILTGSHEVDPEGAHIGGKGTAAPVVIGDGCWLGARSTILPGVSLPQKTVVAAGSVVTRSFDAPKSLLAGVPAKVVKQY